MIERCNQTITGTSARCALPLGHDPGRACEPSLLAIGEADLAEIRAAIMLDNANAEAARVAAFEPRKPNRAARRRGVTK